MVNSVCLETLRAAVEASSRPSGGLRRCIAALAKMKDCPLGAMGSTAARRDAVVVDAVIACAERDALPTCPLHECSPSPARDDHVQQGG